MLVFTAVGMAAAVPPAAAQSAKGVKPETAQVERGRYLVKVAGCNDCHTAGYAMTGGRIPEAQWLRGDKLGWQGPWGTAYPINLRLYMTSMSEAGWVQTARKLRSRPPMPWFALHDMSDGDLKAVYHYVQWLGAAGELAPAFVPPGREVKGPVVRFPAAPQ
jgi:mono/diheme cytochrome c family protein